MQKKKMALFHTPPPRKLDLVLLNRDSPLAPRPVQATFTPGRLAGNIPSLETMGQSRIAARGEQHPWDARGETAAAPRLKVNGKDGQ